MNDCWREALANSRSKALRDEKKTSDEKQRCEKILSDE